MMATATVRRRRFQPVGPVLLIGLGGLLLLNNFGVVSWDIWRTITRIWPVVMVLIGLQALVTGRVDWVGLLILLAAFAVLSLGTRFVPPQREPLAGAARATEVIRQDLQGAQRASVLVQLGGGDLSIGSFAEPGLLARGEVAGERAARLLSEYRVRDGVGRLEIRQGDGGRFSFFGRTDRTSEGLRLDLARGIPLDLEVQAGASEASLDLRDLTVPNLRFRAGAARSTIVMPATGLTQADVQAGAAAISIEVPPGVAASIRNTGSGLSQLEVDETRFRPTGDGYESAEYASTSNRVELTLHTGLARIEIR